MHDGIVIEAVRRNYAADGQNVAALGPVSVSLVPGQTTAIVGPSGCGKSSLLKLIIGLEKVSAGRLKLEGAEITGPSRHVGAVYQAPVLLPWRTIAQNVMLPADVLKLPRGSSAERARALLEMAGLSEFADRYPHELSGGMQQRAGIVRALVHDPALLMMDEPFAALDAITREQMSVELQRIILASRKTVIFITHSITEATFLADHILVMSPRPGRIVAQFHNPAPRPRTLADLASPELAALAQEIRAALDLGAAPRAAA